MIIEKVVRGETVRGEVMRRNTWGHRRYKSVRANSENKGLRESVRREGSEGNGEGKVVRKL